MRMKKDMLVGSAPEEWPCGDTTRQVLKRLPPQALVSQAGCSTQIEGILRGAKGSHSPMQLWLLLTPNLKTITAM